MTGNMPPGWYPDQMDPSKLRWWNGTAWTDGVNQPSTSGHDASLPSHSEARRSVVPAEDGGAVGWMKRHKILTAVGVIVLLSAFGNAMGEDASTDSRAEAKSLTATDVDSNASENDADTVAESSRSPKPKPKPKPSNPYGPQPPQQTQFLSLAASAMDEYATASNDLKAGAALSARNDAMCQLLGSGQVAGWTGTVTTLDSNGDGYGIVTIEMAQDVELGTWNNAFSDIMDDTLVKPGPLLDKLLGLEEGQNVRFSGSFRPSTDTCVNDSRLTQAGSVEDPSFIFRFADVNKLS
jgi:hypothetical protein